MPLEIYYYETPFIVEPVQLDNGSIGLAINGRLVHIDGLAISEARDNQIFSSAKSDNPSDAELVAMFMLGVPNRYFVTPKLIHEGDPDIQQIIANSAKISLEEYNLWEQLFTQYRAS